MEQQQRFSHLLTTLISSVSFSSPACLSFSFASASRPLRIGSSKRFLNSWAVPAIKPEGIRTTSEEFTTVHVFCVFRAANQGSQRWQNGPSWSTLAGHSGWACLISALSSGLPSRLEPGRSGCQSSSADGPKHHITLLPVILERRHGWYD